MPIALQRDSSWLGAAQYCSQNIQYFRDCAAETELHLIEQYEVCPKNFETPIIKLCVCHLVVNWACQPHSSPPATNNTPFPTFFFQFSKLSSNACFRSLSEFSFSSSVVSNLCYFKMEFSLGNSKTVCRCYIRRVGWLWNYCSSIFVGKSWTNYDVRAGALSWYSLSILANVLRLKNEIRY